MADEFDVVTRMARFDAIDTNSITVCRIAGLASEIRENINFNCVYLSQIIFRQII